MLGSGVRKRKPSGGGFLGRKIASRHLVNRLYSISEMERDFLGMNVKDSGSLAKQEGSGSRMDSAYSGGPTGSSFANKICALQRFMAYKAAQDERPRIAFSSSMFHPINTADPSDANYKPPTGQALQKSFSLHQFPMHTFQSQGIKTSIAPTHHVNEGKELPMHHSVPVGTINPLFNISGAPWGPNFTVAALKQQALGGISSGSPSVCPIVGAFGPRNACKHPTSASQLTIFYAGSVNVYDGVPLDKAQEIMLSASKECNTTWNAVNLDAPVTTPAVIDGLNTNQTQNQTPSHPCSGVTTAMSSGCSHNGAQSGSGCSTPDEKAPTNHLEPSKNSTAPLASAAPVSVVPRAIPQARKASLTRFLEKRKERVASASPYPSTNKPSEDAARIDNNPLSSSRKELWSFSCEPKNSTGGGEYLSTKLEM